MAYAGQWFAAEVVDKTSYSLVGCTVTPGFEYRGFKLANVAELQKTFPQHIEIIARFGISNSNLDEQRNDDNDNSRRVRR